MSNPGFRFSIFIFALLALVGCGSSDDGGSSISSKTTPPYCETVASPAESVTITGTAQYQYRENGNGAVAAAARPVRFAEVRALNAEGGIVQCGTTSSTGSVSLQVPKDIGTVTIQIASRALNNNANAYVLTDPIENTFHALTASVTSSTNGSFGTLTAPATGTVLGGAFNILDQMVNAAAFLKTHSSECSSTYPNCNPVTVPPLVTVYWKMGFNPITYVGGDEDEGLSFYIPGDRELYILGGIRGDVNNTDTDHFDNSIILHEYGHFIEDVFAKSDSPGGRHNGNSIIDPRLAWGEGFANFFQAAVTGIPIYRDTSGNTDGVASVLFNENLEVPTNDISGDQGEGNFREFSITRALWDAIDTENEGPGEDAVTSPFNEFWSAFTSDPGGLGSPTNAFRSVGLIHKFQVAAGLSDWSSIRASEKHDAYQKNYATTLTIPGTCSPIPIQAQSNPGGAPENGSFSRSNMFHSNDWYWYQHPGGPFSANLAYTTNANQHADLELFVWKEGYTFGVEADLAAFSTQTSSGTSGSEAISTSLPAGNYMINVYVFTLNENLGLNTQYNLTIGGQKACPN